MECSGTALALSILHYRSVHNQICLSQILFSERMLSSEIQSPDCGHILPRRKITEQILLTSF
jgi:hypothetical protein